MKIYTRQGDDGSTGLFGGQRIDKSDPRIAAIGEVDELNAAVGLVTAALSESDGVYRTLTRIQSELFDLGANLATPPGADRKHIPVITAVHVQRLEDEIDGHEAELPPLRAFILPAGCEAASRMHLARGVCRRAERAVVALHHEEPLDPMLVRFLNRLSDLLFVLARRANQSAGISDTPWTPKT